MSKNPFDNLQEAVDQRDAEMLRRLRETVAQLHREYDAQVRYERASKFLREHLRTRKV